MRPSNFPKWPRWIALAAVILVPVVILTFRFDVIGRVRAIGITKVVPLAWNRVRRNGVVATLKSLNSSVDATPVVGSALTYSIFDPRTMPPVEDAATRQAMPEYVDVPGANVMELPPSQYEARKFDTWYRSGGDDGSSKYSSHDQINVRNVRFLEPAWSYTSGSVLGDSTKTGGTTVETNPVVVGNRMFLTSLDGDLLSLNAETGKEVWRLTLPAPVAKRGLVWEPNANFAESRLFVPSAQGVVVVSAATGKVLKGFGKDGAVGSGMSLIAPLIVDDRLIVATLGPSVEAYDRTTGALLWNRPLLVPADSASSALAGGAPWGGMSADVKRHLAFVVTGNPRPALIGTARPGKNDYSCSVIAIDTRTGAVVWSFQEVNHDLWDLDLPAAPVLATISVGGRRVDVVAVPTKLGNTLLLDRDHGKSIFGYRLRRAPASAVPGERTAAYQPVFARPEPFAIQVFEADQITDLTDSATRTVSRKLRGAKYGFFEPPTLGGKVAYYGIHGGAEWPGGAVDPTLGILYVPSNQVPWVVRTEYTDLKATPESGADLAGHALYKAKCAQCHGGARRGSYQWEGDGDAYFPAMTGITALRTKEQLRSVAYFNERHEGTTIGSAVDAKDLAALQEYFATLDRRSDVQRSFALNAFWQPVLDDRDNPGSKAPWGRLTAIDLNTGKTLWQVPFGQLERARQDGAPVRGLRNSGGVAVTAGGLVFATGTTDNKVRAFDAVTGGELWSHQLPAAGSTMPTVYAVNGTQYVVVVATGGVFRGFSGRADRVIAFKVPTARRGQ